MDFRDLMARPVDLSKLPYDCPAKAAARMRRSYAERGCYDPQDVRIVLGDPNHTIAFPTSSEEVKRHFLRRK